MKVDVLWCRRGVGRVAMLQSCHLEAHPPCSKRWPAARAPPSAPQTLLSAVSSPASPRMPMPDQAGAQIAHSITQKSTQIGVSPRGRPPHSTELSCRAAQQQSSPAAASIAATPSSATRTSAPPLRQRCGRRSGGWPGRHRRRPMPRSRLEGTPPAEGPQRGFPGSAAVVADRGDRWLTQSPA